MTETYLAESTVLAEAGRLVESLGPAGRAAEQATAGGLNGLQGAINLYVWAWALVGLGRWDEAAERLDEARRVVRDRFASRVIEAYHAFEKLTRFTGREYR